MLVLSRRVGEELMIGDTIRVAIVGVVGYQVRIGISAPDEVPVHREEIYRRIQQQASDDHEETPQD